MDKNEFQQEIDKRTNKATKSEVAESIISNNTAEQEELSDFGEYISSEEFIREGKDAITPMKINYNGQDFKVYVRPLTSQEYYTLQLDAMNKKESLDLLACQIAAVDKNGNPLDPIRLAKLKAGVIEDISAGIRLISGIDTNNMDYQEIMQYFLKT